MSLKIVSIESLKERRRQGTVTQMVPFAVNGKPHEVEKKIVNGEMETFEMTKPFGEMITYGSSAQFTELLRKVVLDVELGREQVPVIYGPIYERLSDPNMPKLIDAKWALYGTVIFTEHLEGEEVKFGRLAVEHGPTAKILTFTAGFEYTKEMKDFNDSFSVEILNRSMGESWNALLNHIHLNPIISFNYPDPDNQTDWAGEAGDSMWVGYWKTLSAAVNDANVAKRPGNILLASAQNRANIEMALKGGFMIGGTTYPAVDGIDTVIYYDGWSVTVGKKDYEYGGVTPGEAYLIRPRRGFKELVKQDLRIEAATADLSRLIESQIVGYGYRGVYAAVQANVQKITLAP
ncbi:MAG: aspartate ammonia-lyase [Peptococcaceae bacterium]|nr:aspartate ammonia-lyase [Candidatus Syntrophopropionicum ammoniitolerans]